MKTCRMCQKNKSLTDFYEYKHNQFRLKCKECILLEQKIVYHKNPEKKTKYRILNQKKITDQQRQRYTKEENKRARTSSRLKYDFGITIEQYEELKEKQDNKCVICNKAETYTFHGKIRNLAVDHCHKTGKIRGLLCMACNVSLGNLKDDILLLEKMLEYLKQNATQAVAETDVNNG